MLSTILFFVATILFSNDKRSYYLSDQKMKKYRNVNRFYLYKNPQVSNIFAFGFKFSSNSIFLFVLHFNIYSFVSGCPLHISFYSRKHGNP